VGEEERPEGHRALLDGLVQRLDHLARLLVTEVLEVGQAGQRLGNLLLEDGAVEYEKTRKVRTALGF
jgi:hypothetical protein